MDPGGAIDPDAPPDLNFTRGPEEEGENEEEVDGTQSASNSKQKKGAKVLGKRIHLKGLRRKHSQKDAVSGTADLVDDGVVEKQHSGLSGQLEEISPRSDLPTSKQGNGSSGVEVAVNSSGISNSARLDGHPAKDGKVGPPFLSGEVEHAASNNNSNNANNINSNSNNNSAGGDSCGLMTGSATESINFVLRSNSNNNNNNYSGGVTAHEVTVPQNLEMVMESLRKSIATLGSQVQHSRDVEKELRSLREENRLLRSVGLANVFQDKVSDTTLPTWVPKAGNTSSNSLALSARDESQNGTCSDEMYGLDVQSQMSKNFAAGRSKTREHLSMIPDTTIGEAFRKSLAQRWITQPKDDHEQAWSRCLLPDEEELKRKVRSAIGKPVYDVNESYHDTGICQQLTRSTWMEAFTILVITCNAVWIAIEADMNDQDILTKAHWSFQVGENFFCGYFVFEWLIRFGAFREKRLCLKDNSFLFDTALMLMMVAETWVLLLILIVTESGSGTGLNTGVLRAVRLLRLCRMARLSKLLLALPELLVLFKGITTASRAVLSALFLIAMLVYVFAIFFRQITRGTELEEKFFGSIPDAMSHLLLTSVTPDLVDVFAEDFGPAGGGYAILYFIFIMLVSFTVMNLLVGVLVNVVAVVARVEQEALQVELLRKELSKALSCLDENDDQRITKEEFCTMLVKPEVLSALKAASVDCIGLADFAEFFFESAQTMEDGTPYLTTGQLLELVCQLRGGNIATVKDIVDIRRFMSLTLNDVEGNICKAINGSPRNR